MIRRSTKSISFLMEFIIVILFFAISSAVCVNLYAHAQQINDEANYTKTALLLAQNYINDDKEAATITYNAYGDESKDGVLVLKHEQTPDGLHHVNVYYKEQLLVTLPYVKQGGSYEK